MSFGDRKEDWPPHGSQPDRYTLGFIFDTYDRVLLLTKRRPDWQKGRKNGVGGKVKKERTIDCMVREAQEECGLLIPATKWQRRVNLYGFDWAVYVFSTVWDGDLGAVQFLTDESGGWYNRHRLPGDVVPNLRWLIPLCLDDDLVTPIAINDKSEPAKNGATVRSANVKNAL